VSEGRGPLFWHDWEPSYLHPVLVQFRENFPLWRYTQQRRFMAFFHTLCSASLQVWGPSARPGWSVGPAVLLSLGELWGKRIYLPHMLLSEIGGGRPEGCCLTDHGTSITERISRICSAGMLTWPRILGRTLYSGKSRRSNYLIRHTLI